MTFEVEYRPDTNIRFTQPLMSCEWNGKPVKVTQSIGGSHLCLAYGEQRFIVSVEQLAQSWLAAVTSEDSRR
jgi:hypothetical protein